MKFDLDGQAVFASDGGRKHDSSRRNLILLHGSGVNQTFWSLQTRYLAYHGFNVVSVDLPGHGQSDGPLLGSIADLAEWLGKGEVKLWQHQLDKRSEATLHTAAGWRVVSKSYDQGVEKWAGARLQGIHLDEPPPDDIVREARARCLREQGYLLTTMTPLGGVQSDLFESLYLPFEARLPELRQNREARGKTTTSCSLISNRMLFGSRMLAIRS